jgi:hypothetical protein
MRVEFSLPHKSKLFETSLGDWRRGIRNRQAAVTLRQTSKDRDLKSLG